MIQIHSGLFSICLQNQNKEKISRTFNLCTFRKISLKCNQFRSSEWREHQKTKMILLTTLLFILLLRTESKRQGKSKCGFLIFFCKQFSRVEKLPMRIVVNFCTFFVGQSQKSFILPLHTVVKTSEFWLVFFWQGLAKKMKS